MIGTFAYAIPPHLLDRSGSVFFSGREAFSGTRPLYLLGVNPGGNPERMVPNTVRSHTSRVLEEMPDNCSAYRDERWQDADPGTAGMQRRVLYLLRRLGLDPE